MAPTITFEESKHYDGKVTVKFYPKAHFYKVDDPDFPGGPLVGERMGGATSLTGTMNKGMGLMMYPMYEATKYLRAYFRTTTVEEFCDGPLTMFDILKEATKAHVKKSDRGKGVGKDAHAWVEEYLARLASSQHGGVEFMPPDIDSVEDIALTLRKSYISIINTLKPKTLEEYRKLPKLIMRDTDIQETIWIEATMLHKSTTAAKEWFSRHDIKVHGVESVVYSRKLKICGSYDSDLTVTCSKRCGWCYRNQPVPEGVEPNEAPQDFTGRYVVDFKSTNASTDAPKGIYKEYLAQCGIYMQALLEEFPDRKYGGALILNGSKNDGTFSSHFSFENERNMRWAHVLAGLRDLMHKGDKEIKESL